MQNENVIYILRYASPCGELILGSFGDRLCLCDWTAERHRAAADRRLRTVLRAEYREEPSAVLEETVRELDAYFRGERRAFDIPLLLIGTDFQKQVWRELRRVVYGTVMSYRELAGRIGRPTAVRAVANANGANALSILVPCHRIIGSDRSLTGYGGGLEAKRYLLALEAANSGE